MSKSNLDLLIQKFYEATISDQEEAVLKAYFESDQVDEEHLKDKALFLALQNQFTHPDSKMKNPDFNQMINQLFTKEEEDDAQFLQMMERNATRVPLHKTNKRKMWISAAAIFLLLISLSYPLYRSMLNPVNEPREMTYEEYKSSMLLVSRKLNQGADQAEKADQTMLKTKKILQRTLIIMPNEN